MTSDTTRARSYLAGGDLRTLFIEALGWDRHAAALRVTVDGSTVDLHALAQKRGMVAYQCAAPAGQPLPDYRHRRKIEHQVTKAAREHLIVFTDSSNQIQIWQWVKREPGKPTACREHIYHCAQPGDALLQKLNAITFTLKEEDDLVLVDVTGRTRAAFDVDRVTKRFYERFQKEHAAFLRYIIGIPESADREWYASIMLNRLMFIYFIQRKGFLDGDRNYLRNKLVRLRAAHGADKFYSFYRYFLLRLFHEGLGGTSRTRELEMLVGHIPYLNGGLFDVHELEQSDRYGQTIQIADTAFEHIFDYFDQYQWHLDERPLRADDEINPDVLGYIFEKYINQKQMGAYYTKEDITEYISKNTVLPFVIDAARAKCLVAFENPTGFTVWDVLRDEPDRYIYAAVRHGADEPLPADIAAGLSLPTLHLPVDDGPVQALELRKGWNRPAPRTHALPTETWREVIARRARYEEIKAKLAGGEVRDINDLITLNLDIRQFVQDAIESCEGPDLLRAFWHAIEKVTVLDPTCGSGAFLFAALNILEPLYEACLERMEAFVADLARSGRKQHPETYSDFRKVLARVAAHPNRRYFIFKSIILNNLFGVDIMEEAVEICKLRLFLKLAAQVEPDRTRDNLGIEPLPDIDFNIRAGNTLVGYVTLDAARQAISRKFDFDNAAEMIAVSAADLQQAFDAFRARQTEGDGSVPPEEKDALRRRLTALGTELNRYLAREYGVEPLREHEFTRWLQSHQPFHWFVEFYGIMAAGGFDVIIGNPPYVASSTVQYLSVASARELPDLYAHVLVRSLELAECRSRCGMIVPLSVTFSEDFGSLRTMLTSVGKAWFSSFDNRPATLFANVSQRCTIWIGDRSRPETMVSPMYRWKSEARATLIDTIAYTRVVLSEVGPAGLPKLGSQASYTVLAALKAAAASMNRVVVLPSRKGADRIRFSQSARNFVSAFKEEPPCLEEDTLNPVRSLMVGEVALTCINDVYAALAALIGESYFWYWLTRGDGFHVTQRIVSDFLKTLSGISDESFELMVELGCIAHQRRFEALVFAKNAGKYVGSFNYRGHAWLTRRADLVLLAGLGLDRAAALEIFDYVQRILVINVFAGEKSIPDSVKASYRPQLPDESREQHLLCRVDSLIQRRLGFTRSELDYLLYEEVRYVPAGRDEYERSQTE
jgi:hypothetical protein